MLEFFLKSFFRLKYKVYPLSLSKIHFCLLTYFCSIESFKFQSYSIQAFCLLSLKNLSLSMQLTNKKKRCFEKNFLHIKKNL